MSPRKKTPTVWCDGQLEHGCGRPVRKYPITLNTSMVTGLAFCARFYTKANPMPLGILSDLFGGQKSNVYMSFRNLRLFGLTAWPLDEEGRRRIGWWYVTDVGRWFLANEHDVHRKLWTFANAVTEVDPKMVSVKDVPYLKVDYDYAVSVMEGATEEDIEIARAQRDKREGDLP